MTQAVKGTCSVLRAETRFSNARLYNLIVSEFTLPAHQFRAERSGRGALPLSYCASVAIGINQDGLRELLNLKSSPWNRWSGRLNRGAKAICDYFGLEPELLFPKEIYSLGLDKPIVRIISEEDVVRLAEVKSKLLIAAPDEPDWEEERKQALETALQSLKPREREALLMRFGLDGNEQTLEQIGRRFGVQRERARQIEKSGLRKLRSDREFLKALGRTRVGG